MSESCPLRSAPRQEVAPAQAAAASAATGEQKIVQLQAYNAAADNSLDAPLFGLCDIDAIFGMDVDSMLSEVGQSTTTTAFVTATASTQTTAVDVPAVPGAYVGLPPMCREFRPLQLLDDGWPLSAERFALQRLLLAPAVREFIHQYVQFCQLSAAVRAVAAGDPLQSPGTVLQLRQLMRPSVDEMLANGGGCYAALLAADRAEFLRRLADACTVECRVANMWHTTTAGWLLELFDESEEAGREAR